MSKHSHISAIFDNAFQSRAGSPDVYMSMVFISSEFNMSAVIIAFHFFLLAAVEIITKVDNAIHLSYNRPQQNNFPCKKASSPAL